MQRCKTHGKFMYPSQTRAIKVALASSRKRGAALRVYFHKDCHSFHLTKQPLRQEVAS